MPVTLEQLLQSRDNRAQYQKDLLGHFPGKSLLCLTVQLPGPEKRNEVSLKIAKAGVEAIRHAFAPDYEELRDLETGFEGYFLVQLDPFEAKRLSCQIEDSHPLGRLMDIDVLCHAEARSSCHSEELLFCHSEERFSCHSEERSDEESSGAMPTAEANYFSQGFAKNQFASANATPTHEDVFSRPTAEEKYFSCSCPKNHFSSAIATPTHIIGRKEIGLEARGCLLCDQPARYCMRAHTHSVADLLDKIEQMVKTYK